MKRKVVLYSIAALVVIITASFTAMKLTGSKSLEAAVSSKPVKTQKPTPTPESIATNRPTPRSDPTPKPYDEKKAIVLPANGIVEAEKGVLNGVEIKKAIKGYSGGGYIDGFDKTGDSLELLVKVDKEGSYNLTARYAAPYGDKKNNLIVNGDLYGSIESREGDTFQDAFVGRILLNKGINSIKVDMDWGWFALDYIKLASAKAPDLSMVSKKLVNAKATKEAQALMSYLVDMYGKKIISGQQADQSTSELFYIKGQSGKMPAIRGFDLLNYTPLINIDDGTTNNAIKWYNEEKGIVTMCWHWRSPSKIKGDKYAAFYTDSTDFNIEEAIKENSEDYKLLLKDIDAIAVQLKKLQDAGVPVLWRPLHEADGGWFWWGAKGPEPYKKLYKLLYDRLVNYNKLNNLIWVWNAPNPDWYPGDQYVDIASCDIYAPEGNYGPNTSSFDKVYAIVKGKKLVTLAENGPIPDPDKLVASKTAWSWFSPWNGKFINDGKQNSTDHINRVYNHDYVITLDELPDLRNYPIGNK